MKLRLKGDSIRLRLSKKEVRQIGEGLMVREDLQLAPGQVWSYELEPHAETTSLIARFDGPKLRIQLPLKQATEWAQGEEIAIQCALPNGNDPGLFVLIEKDFQCLKPREFQNEDETDLFINPNEQHGSCGGK